MSDLTTERCPNTIHSDYVSDHQCFRTRWHDGDCWFGFGREAVCDFGCGPYPHDSAMVGEGVGLVPACPVHGWLVPLLDARDAEIDRLRARLTTVEHLREIDGEIVHAARHELAAARAENAALREAGEAMYDDLAGGYVHGGVLTRWREASSGAGE